MRELSLNEIGLVSGGDLDALDAAGAFVGGAVAGSGLGATVRGIKIM